MHDANGNPAMFLLKMGTRDHMKQFRNGLLYMNTLRFFRELEGDAARADRYEGIDHIFQAKDAVLRITAPGFGEFVVPPEDWAGPSTISMNATARCNLFCLYSLQEPVNGSLFPPEHEWFGDSVVLVTNTQEFFHRLANAAQKSRLIFEGRPVEYYDEQAYTGKLGIFKKSSKYAHQREYRFAIRTDGTTPMTLDVGDLMDITSEIVPFCDADSVFKFSEADAVEAGLLW